MAKRKTWTQKLHVNRVPEVEILDKEYAGHSPGAGMLISTPVEIENYIWQIPEGTFRQPDQMKSDLCAVHEADFMCPLTGGIFLRIVAEAAHEQLLDGKEAVAPYWRIVAANSPTADKLTFGKEPLIQLQTKEFGQPQMLAKKRKQ